MKFWNINKSKNLYLIVSEHTMGVINYESEAALKNSIAEDVLSHVDTFKFNSIKKAILNHTDCSIEITFKDNNTNDLDLYEIESNVYQEIKNLLITNLKGVVVKNYSMYEQLKFSVLGVFFVSCFTWAFYSTALTLESGGSVSVSGRRGFIKKIFVWISELLGTTGSLIVGGILIALFLYTIIAAIIKPKEGDILKFGDTSKLNF